MRHSLRSHLYIAMAAVTAVALLISALANGYLAVKRERDQALAMVRSQVEIVGFNIEPALLFNDSGAAAELLAGLQAQPQYERTAVFLVDSASRTVGDRFAFTGDALIDPNTALVNAPIVVNSRLRLATWIGQPEEPSGLLLVDVKLPALNDVIVSYLLVAIGVMVVAGAVAAPLAHRFTRVLTKPVDEFANLAEAIVSRSNWHLRAPEVEVDELSRVGHSFNRVLATIENEISDRQQRQQQVDDLNRTLEEKVKQRTAALGDRNNQLQLALERLSKSQAQLVEREKMASLGELVAGVAHEINTPVGISITATSLLRGETQQIRHKVEQGQLSQRQFNEYLKAMEEGAEIAWRNLERAAELIRSFKQVAVDQSSEDERQFNLYRYLEEVINSLKPRLKRTIHQIKLTGDPEIVINGQPGRFAQLLTNLIMNSLIHGFAEGADGLIEIDLTVHERMDDLAIIHLRYSDNGQGLSADNLRKLFVPFFTTKRNEGGSGLGTHIIYNIVTHALRGSIDAISEPGRGLTYQIEFPVKLLNAKG